MPPPSPASPRQPNHENRELAAVDGVARRLSRSPVRERRRQLTADRFVGPARARTVLREIPLLPSFRPLLLLLLLFSFRQGRLRGAEREGDEAVAGAAGSAGAALGEPRDASRRDDAASVAAPAPEGGQQSRRSGGIGGGAAFCVRGHEPTGNTSGALPSPPPHGRGARRPVRHGQRGTPASRWARWARVPLFTGGRRRRRRRRWRWRRRCGDRRQRRWQQRRPCRRSSCRCGRWRRHR